ncbi:MAG: hypothetical protein HY579_06695 [Nitrospinae bacterium]|nr:hypothetical protein [Nitrospinota bacterium]
MPAFLFYGFLLIPLGDYRQPEEFHPGHYNIQKIDPGDDTGFYAYLRSGAIDGDFDFFNEKRYWHYDAVTKTGYAANYWYIGSAMLWSPGFLVGHAAAWLYNTVGYPVSIDGYSFPYHAATFLSSACEVFLALLLCHWILQKMFSRRVSLFATLLMFSASCLPYYAFVRNRMSHPGDLLMAFVFFSVFIGFRERPVRSKSFYLFLGAVAGLLADLRYSNVVYCVLPLGLALKVFLASETAPEVKKKLAVGTGLAVMAFIIVFAPQLSAWKKLHGVFDSMNPFTVVVHDVSSAVDSLKALFFGNTRGLAWVEPVWLLGLAGMALVFFRDRWFGGVCWFALLGVFIPPVVIGDPASFGQRYLVPAFPFLALGLAQLSETFFEKRLGPLVIGIAALLSLWLYFLLLNCKVLVDDVDPLFAFKSFRNIPFFIANRVFFRPTTYPDLLLDGKLHLEDFLDYFFLMIFPALLAVGPIALLIVFNKIAEASERDKGLSDRIMARCSAALFAFAILLTVFIVVRHPELSPEIRKNRLQIAAASQILFPFPDVGDPAVLLRRSLEIAPADERDRLIAGDAYFLKGDLKRAVESYSQAVEINKNSTANLQIERIETIEGKEIDVPALQEEVQRKGDPTGEIHRKLGLYFLDRLFDTGKAIDNFKVSLQINPDQRQAAGMKRLVEQAGLQNERLAAKNVKQIPLKLFLLLNTETNETRLHHYMPVQRY